MTERDTRLEWMLVGESEIIRGLRATIARIAKTTMPVLLYGPTGSGKEVAARALHEQSGRPGRFVAVNVCALSDAMFEDALFGHVRGAFTGALQHSGGYLMEGNRGSVFLDEIATLPMTSQAKLLRAVETRAFRPVGASSDSQSDFRVVAATNEDPQALVGAGRFRLDLLHRLAGITVTLPALADHIEDLPALVQCFIRREASHVHVRIESSALSRLQLHTWPGNVRELFATLGRMIALSEGAALSAGMADMAIHGGFDSTRLQSNQDARQQLVRVLIANDWSVDRAAGALGLHRATLYRRIRRFGILLPPPSGGVQKLGVSRNVDAIDDSDRRLTCVNGDFTPPRPRHPALAP